jgi:hypothetical protein
MSIINNNNKINSSEELWQQVRSAREILLKPFLVKITVNENNREKDIIYFPSCLEAHILALIKDGLS